MPPSAFGPYAGFDYGVCNTPTAAAALSALGGQPRQVTPATAPATTTAPTTATAAGDEMVACEVVCNGMLGQLLLKAPPLRIRVAATGEVFGPLDFERVAGCAHAQNLERCASLPSERATLVCSAAHEWRVLTWHPLAFPAACCRRSGATRCTFRRRARLWVSGWTREAWAT